MNTASQILEAKGYDSDEIEAIISWGVDGESLDNQSREKFGIECQFVHLFAEYTIGDANAYDLNVIAKKKGFSDYKELLKATTFYLNHLAEMYPQKKSQTDVSGSQKCPNCEKEHSNNE